MQNGCSRTQATTTIPGAPWLAATPTFAMMALLTASSDGHGMMCMSGAGDSMPSGMVPMYLLMAGFHLAPWLRLVAKRA